MKKPEIISFYLSNTGDEAVFVNSRLILSFDSRHAGLEPSADNVAKELAASLGTVVLYACEERQSNPCRPDWSWDEVYKTIDRSKMWQTDPDKTVQPQPDIEPVAHWNSDVYKGDSGEPGLEKEFLMELQDHRQKCGQLSVTVAPVEGDLDDILDAHFEISRLPGSRDCTQSLHVHFDANNEAFRLFKQGDKYIMCVDNDVDVVKTKLADGSRGFIIQ